VLSGPSGVGKTTMVKELRRRLPGSVFSVSGTTRQRTPREVDGVDYHFLSPEEFERRVQAGEFLEHATFAGARYGTLRAPVDEALAAGKIMILDIDVQGGRQVRATRPDCLALFILPPDEATLLARLRDRARDDEAAIQRRFARARGEIDEARTSAAYDAFIVNDDLESAVASALTIIRARLAARA
jgi:guanylate kinase